MKILSWNCQGLNNHLTVQALHSWCLKERPSIVFVIETMMESHKLEGIRRKFSFSDGFCVSSEGHSGGLGLWWRDCTTTLISYSSHHILIEVQDDMETGSTWHACRIYGWADHQNKSKTWELMGKIRRDTRGPLIMFGDFNEIHAHHEKEGGCRRHDKEITAFRDRINSCGLNNLGFRGCSFTWCRGLSRSSMIRERQDRFLACGGWLDLFEFFEVRHFPIHRSDHAPILLCTNKHPVDGCEEKLFRFESLWLSSDECRRVVSDAWQDSVGDNITFRITHYAGKLSDWAEAKFGALRSKIKESERKLKAAQRCPLNDNMVRTSKMLSTELDDLHRMEESYWHMRSRANELRDGDRNSKYFHHKASFRRRRNLIKGLEDEHGRWKTSRPDIERIITTYYSNLFSSSSPTDFDEAAKGLDAVITDDMHESLELEPSADEIRTATFQMHPTKAPGIDGFMHYFTETYGTSWVVMLYVLLRIGGVVSLT